MRQQIGRPFDFAVCPSGLIRRVLVTCVKCREEYAISSAAVRYSLKPLVCGQCNPLRNTGGRRYPTYTLGEYWYLIRTDPNLTLRQRAERLENLPPPMGRADAARYYTMKLRGVWFSLGIDFKHNNS